MKIVVMKRYVLLFFATIILGQATSCRTAKYAEESRMPVEGNTGAIPRDAVFVEYSAPPLPEAVRKILYSAYLALPSIRKKTTKIMKLQLYFDILTKM